MRFTVCALCTAVKTTRKPDDFSENLATNVKNADEPRDESSTRVNMQTTTINSSVQSENADVCNNNIRVENKAVK